jgi:hypothetical protein
MKNEKLTSDNIVQAFVDQLNYQRSQIEELSCLIPDQTTGPVMRRQQRGRSPDWKNPFLWTDEEVHELVMREVGIDETFATGFKVLLKLWTPPETKNGLHVPQTIRKNDISVIGMIIGLGGDAFCDIGRFPSGPPHTYGEWAIFRPYEDQKIKKCGKHLLTFVNDERFQGFDIDPTTVQSALKLEEEYNMVS